MLNFLLYGSTNDSFEYKDFLSSFGTIVSNASYGDIVIGNDALLGGILTINNECIIPIPNGNITIVTQSHLKTYFPKGYIFRRTPVKNYTLNSYSGTIYNSVRGLYICHPCQIDLWSYKDVPLFTEQSVFHIDQHYELHKPYIHMNGYFTNFDTVNQTGVMVVTLTESSLGDSPVELVQQNIGGVLHFSVKNGQLYYDGFLLIYLYKNSGSYYYVTGTLQPTGFYQY